MDSLEERLRERLNAAFGGNESELARAVGTDQQNINNFMTGKVKGSHIWREVAAALQIPEDEMKRLIDERKGRRPSPAPNATIVPLNQVPTNALPKMMPVLGEAVGGADGEYIFNGQILDWVPCIPSLINVPGAYAVFLDGESMVPRYYPREIAYVHPTKPVRHGDHVVVQIRARSEDEPPRGFVKKFTGWKGARLTLEQYNPPIPIEFDKDDVVSVHLIVQAGAY
ncbi:S24 family peptidase [Shinella sp. DD12]|uniref:S24 family peptidase n=1 Tax=Shinella sp. DD12 TaxID=1410620 RepID=UPI00043798AC|nr:S24 family peptidase [Shinella sp. DD12]EYR81799.1 putative transcriptional regulator [Shinella sp. DD12]